MAFDLIILSLFFEDTNISSYELWPLRSNTGRQFISIEVVGRAHIDNL